MAGLAQSAPVTILFTNLVNSSELLQKAGDEKAQRILQAHRELLREAVAASSGQEVKWLGDGLMVAFPSAADAVRCAIAMQRAAHKPVLGERLQIRVGLNVGEPLRDESDYFGTPVVVARRLCDLAQAGQILCRALIAGLLPGREAFTFQDYGELRLKGIPEPVSASEVIYEISQEADLGKASPAPETRTAPVTILYTDLVDSTQLMQRAGDERAQPIFKTHRKLLQEAVAANGGRETQWLGDGLMVTFATAADAVRCAIAMQQGARRHVAGERLRIRIGLNVGELLKDEADYFGTPGLVAQELCDSAKADQILCSGLVAGFLAGRQAFTFLDRGALEVSGVAGPVPISEVVYDIDRPAALLGHPPFVGRRSELEQLDQSLQEATAGQGGLVMLIGEPGIGKTRTTEEFTEIARSMGATVLWGRCLEGEWAPPFGPFAEAIEEYSKVADPDALREDLGSGIGPIARLAPALRERLPDIPEPVALQPDEESFRLLDAVAQFLIAIAGRAPLVLVLDDLHWADMGTIAMLRHVARFAPRHRILLLGAYRDVELDRQHPLAGALGALRRETNFKRIQLKGLESGAVGQFVAAIAEHDTPEALVSAISSETNGNPFFIREILLHLVESGAIHRQDGQWVADARSVDELGIPEGVRQVIGQRLSRLSDDANRLLTAASAFSGEFRFDIAASVAGLDEMAALDAVDEALPAQLLRPGAEPDRYDFTHALVRHTLYTELNPSRQVRLHRQIAEAMERTYGSQATEHASELAYQYHRSAALPGAEAGIAHTLIAADQAEAAYARDEVVTFLRMALELLPQDDVRKPQVLGRQGLALAWTLNSEGALKAATEAGKLIAASEDRDVAADYLAQAAHAMFGAGMTRGAWELTALGLGYAGDRRDATWASLTAYDLLRREAEDPDNPGIPLDSPERREVTRIVEQLPRQDQPGIVPYYSSREDVLVRGGDDDPVALTYLAGELRRGLQVWQRLATQHEEQGQIANAVSDWAQVARSHNALGDFAVAQEACDRGVGLTARLAGPSPQALQIISARLDLRFTLDPDREEYLAETEPLLQQPAAENSWAAAALRAVASLSYAGFGRAEESVRWLGTLVAPLERAPGWATNYTLLPCLCASALWVLERTDHIEVIERNLREKVIAPDFRFPMQDGRMAMAQLAALQGRYDEAVDWFDQARAVLDEQESRPLRAIVDLIQAQMYVRRASPGDGELAQPILESALDQLRDLGMPGWIKRAEQLGALLQGT